MTQSTTSGMMTVPVRAVKSRRFRAALLQLPLFALLGAVTLLTLFPIFYMAFSSLKSNYQILGDFWSFPRPPQWSNYGEAFRVIYRYMVNTLVYAVAGGGCVVVLSALSGYTFAKKQFPGKDLLFLMMLALMMIPGILTLIPSYVLYEQLGLVNTPWAIIVMHAAGGQLLGTFLCRSSMSGIPNELFDAGRIDGASEWTLFARIVIPLSVPILMTILIMQCVTIYNDYIWPLLTISDSRLQVVAVGLTLFRNQFGVSDMGVQFAAYAISSLPLVVIFSFGTRYYIQGMTQGAIKM